MTSVDGTTAGRVETRPAVLRLGRKWLAIGLFLALWIVAATMTLVVQRVRASPQRGLAARLGAGDSA